MFLKIWKPLAVALAISLAGCGTTEPIIEIRTVEVPVEPEYTHPALPEGFSIIDSEWVIIELEDQKYAAVRLSDYQFVVENITKATSHIEKLNAIIKYYRQITGATNEESSTEN